MTFFGWQAPPHDGACNPTLACRPIHDSPSTASLPGPVGGGVEDQLSTALAARNKKHKRYHERTREERKIRREDKKNKAFVRGSSLPNGHSIHARAVESPLLTACKKRTARGFDPHLSMEQRFVAPRSYRMSSASQPMP